MAANTGNRSTSTLAAPEQTQHKAKSCLA